MTTQIAISRIHFPVTTLGPGRRVGIWMQGCSIRCPGCISKDTWAPGRGRTVISEVLGRIASWIPSADGFTISGGEPFDQPDALGILLAGIRELSAADILIYTGYPIEEIGPQLSSLDGLIDALIADPFDQAAPQTLALRGSDNQRLVLLTALGRERFAGYDRRADVRERSVDIMFDANGEIWLAGIPARDDFLRLRRLLRDAGADVVISQGRSDSTHTRAATK
jgi:anaerobic ribonucleoside-triphosphate reductase activating protein